MGLKTGIYSGSFNPIHIGHLALANWLCEFEGLDEVWFVVTPHNPLKKRMTCSMTHYGWKWPKPLLTDILNSGSAILSSTYRNLLIPLIPYEPYPVTIRIGTFILSWEPITGSFFPDGKNTKNTPRLQTADLSPPRIRHLDPGHLSEREKVDAPLMEISSTFIRNAYQADKDIRFFLPEGVRPYYYKI